MMNKKGFSKKMAMVILAGTMMMGMSTTAFAQASPPEDTQTEATTEDATPVVTENPATAEAEAATTAETETEASQEDAAGDAFSVPGNAEVLDDVTDGSSKEFLTIRTENNNTFYVIIDRATNQENVYMLSNIDENDLQEFLEEGSTGITGETSVVLDEQPTTTPAVAETLPEEEAPKTNTNKGALIAILAIALCGLAGYYYFKIYKPKKEEEDYEDENMEISDGLETVNEDKSEEKNSEETEE